MKKKLATYCLFIFLYYYGSAQVEALVTTDKFEYQIGDYITIQLTAKSNKSIEYNWPQPENIAPYSLISANPIDTLVQNGNTIISQKIIYSIYDAGKYYFPQVSIPYKNTDNGEASLIKTDSLPFNVLSPQIDTTAAVKPIFDIVDVKNRSQWWWFVIIPVVLILLIYFIVRKLKQKPAPKVAPLPIPELVKINFGDKALQALQELESKNLPQQQQIKLYYSELTDILRLYMEQHFGFNAMESTSDEILEQMNSEEQTKTHVADIQTLLQLSDMVKFAKSKPTDNDHNKVMVIAKQFVSSTKQINDNQ